jgi:hypothetical protein
MMTFDNRVSTDARRSGQTASSASELARTRRRWDRVFIRCYLPYVAIGAFLAASIPASGIQGIDALVKAVAEIVPSIDRLARVSPFPEMTRTYGALMWLMYPVFTLWAAFMSPRIPRRKLSWTALLLVMPVCIACLVVLGVLVPFVFQEVTRELNYDHGRGVAGLTFIVTSRLGHGTLGALLFAVSSFCTVMTWRFLRDYPGLLILNIRSRLERKASHG